MDQRYFDRQQASTYCEKFGQLAGKTFINRKGEKELVDCITMVPAGHCKPHLLSTYIENKNLSTTLSMHPASQYDIMFIIKKLNGNGCCTYIYKEPTDFLQEHNLPIPE